jgi:inorganic pyrophosphatase
VRSPPGEVLVVVEIPKGSRNKYEFDPATNRFYLDRMLFSAVHYPTDYGFIPETLGEDGDPLDALVLVGEPTFPGCVIRARPVGLFEMSDEKGPDAKILAVPVRDPEWSRIESLADVSPHLLREIVHFFAIYKELEGKTTRVGDWKDAEAAWRRIHDGADRLRRRARSAS